MQLNATHDPERQSWVTSANLPGADFPLQNLPFGVFVPPDGRARGGVAIGDSVLDLEALRAFDLVRGTVRDVLEAATGSDLAPLIALGRRAAGELRGVLFELLARGGALARDAAQAQSALLLPLSTATLCLPTTPRSFTDFCSSQYHIRRLGQARSGPAHPAWERLPVAYNGRASTVVASGTPVRRPLGQTLPPGASQAMFGPEPMLDFELEVGAWVTGDTSLGAPLYVDAAEEHIFGYCLVNDWSARGMQFLEMALGPFLGKSFLTTVSPWLITAEALAPFRTVGPARLNAEPPVPAYLDSARQQAEGGLDVTLEVLLRTPDMRERLLPAQCIATSSTRHLFWTFAQMLCHQASNGATLCNTDLVASGTVSGPEAAALGCFAELSAFGTAPITLADGERRAWLHDGDEVQLRGYAERTGYVSVGFGACDAVVVAASDWPKPL